jgi:RNA polymerase primary sigma factor
MSALNGLGNDFPKLREKKYQKLREDLTAQVEACSSTRTRSNILVDNLYSPSTAA